MAIRSGGEVDAWAADLAGPEPLAAARPRGPETGEDPHWWQDPRNALRALAAIRDALTAADPAGRADYAAAAAAASRRVRALDAAIERCWAAVPPADRTLVSSHDSYGYYADRYGLRVLGSVIPSLSSRAQPSAGETARLVRAIRRHHVRAVFAERGLNAASSARSPRRRARRSGVRCRATRRATTYLEALAADTRTLVDGLAGRQVECDL